MGASVPFHRPSITREDRRAVDRVLRSGWLTTGSEAERFEAEFAEAVGASHALAVSSCTAALHLALVCCRLRPEDEVIVPTMTFTATAAAVLMAGARPVIADVDPESLTLTAETIIPVHTRHTRVVLPVHYGGTPTGFPGVLAFARQYRQRVIDDAAHALPASVAAGPIGSDAVGSDATCFSFYATKTLTTAEGGMLTTRWPEWAARARRLTLHGVDADAYQRSRTAIYHYEVMEHGYKYNLPDLLAALGRSQLARHRLLSASRRDTARAYADGFAPLVARGLVRLPMAPPDGESAWHLYPIRLAVDRFRSGWTRDRVGAVLRERGIGTSMHYRPLHRHRFWAELLDLDTKKFPHADRAYEELLSLPIWPGMTSEDRRQVIDGVTAVVEEAAQ